MVLILDLQEPMGFNFQQFGLLLAFLTFCQVMFHHLSPSISISTTLFLWLDWDVRESWELKLKKLLLDRTQKSCALIRLELLQKILFTLKRSYQYMERKFIQRYKRILLRISILTYFNYFQLVIPPKKSTQNSTEIKLIKKYFFSLNIKWLKVKTSLPYLAWRITKEAR